MRCDFCRRRTATVHVTQQGPADVEVRVNLYADCARERKLDDPSGLPLADLLGAFKKD